MEDENSILPPTETHALEQGEADRGETSRSLKYPGRPDIALPDC